MLNGSTPPKLSASGQKIEQSLPVDLGKGRLRRPERPILGVELRDRGLEIGLLDRLALVGDLDAALRQSLADPFAPAGRKAERRLDRKSTRLTSSPSCAPRIPSSPCTKT